MFERVNTLSSLKEILTDETVLLLLKTVIRSFITCINSTVYVKHKQTRNAPQMPIVFIMRVNTRVQMFYFLNKI